MIDTAEEPGLNLIDGKTVEAHSRNRFENVNPATESVLGSAADSGIEDVAVAIGAARRAFDETSWAADTKFRHHCLVQLQAALCAEQEHLRRIVVEEAGAPVLLTHTAQIDLPIHDLGYWIEMAAEFEFERSLLDSSIAGWTSRRRVLYEPVGVVAAITAWNYPFFLNLAKLGPALAAGCTVILKPAPETPWSGTVLGRIIAEQTDIPPGVVNVVTSSDPALGEALTSDPRVDMVAFTGSTATGRRILGRCAETVKRTVLELGGKSAAVVLGDADLSIAIRSTVGAVCSHAGQGCALPTRLLVPAERFDDAVDVARESIAKVRYGDPTDVRNVMGPLISDRQRRRVLGYIDAGRSESELLAGGGVPDHLPVGYFIEPTLFGPVPPDALIAQEEIFGPVLSMIRYSDESDAVRIANGTIYGLSTSVWSGDDDHAQAIAGRLRAGTVTVNGGIAHGPDAPFGGFGQSGLGREGGLEGFQAFLEPKTLAFRTA